MWRRVFLLIALGAVLNSLPAAAQSLRQEAEQAGILVGAAVNVAYLSEAAYTATLAREFNMIEAEDAMKWSVLRPDGNTFNFTDGDRLVDFAEAHTMKVRGHNLVWGTHNPAWLADGHFTPTQLRDLLRKHIQKVGEHYRGKVFAWDVVNEAFDEDGNLRHNIWSSQPGTARAENSTAYIERSFRWTHEVDPHALLFYNDADAEALNQKSDAIYSMVKDFKRRGVPIDGIGLQMHIFNLAPDIASIAANIDRFTKLGVQIHITEMDVALPVNATGDPLDPRDLIQQAEIYYQIATACLAHPGCSAIQTWGFTDKYSFLGWFTHRTKGDGLLFDRQYKPKPAYDALRRAFAAHPNR